MYRPILIATVNFQYEVGEFLKYCSYLKRIGFAGIRFNFAKQTSINQVRECVEKIILLKEKIPNIQIMIDIPYPGRKPRIILYNTRMLKICKNQKLFLCKTNNERVQFVESNYYDYSFKLDSTSQLDELKEGESIIYGDGQCILRVEKVLNTCLVLRTMNDAVLYTGKSVSFGKVIKDKINIEFRDEILRASPDEIAFSFVSDINDLNNIYSFCGKNKLRIVSKIENEAGLNNIDLIRSKTDIMFARGDLVLNSQYAKLYEHQDKVLSKSFLDPDKRIYVATGILESLNYSAIPSQADIIDITNILKYYPYGIIFNAALVRNKGNEVVEFIDLVLKYLPN